MKDIWDYDEEKYKDWKWWITDGFGKKRPMVAKLVSRELIEVRPPSPPLNIFFYCDFKYDFNYKEKIGKQIFSEIDPYGEENWEE